MDEKDKRLGGQKWFFPLVLLLLAVIALSSFVRPPTEEKLTEEQQIEEMCNAIKGVSNAKVMITYQALPVGTFLSEKQSQREILGIAVLCNGGESPEVRLAIHRLLETLFQLSSTRITVSARN